MEQAALVHVIDDDERIRKGLQVMLESAGLGVRVYDTAEHFIENVESGCAGCLVLDLKMPGMDGLTLLQRLRAKHCDMPVIILSGQADVAAAVQSMKLGALDLIEKPFETQTLLALTQKAIRDSESIQRHQTKAQMILRRFASLTVREQQLLKLLVAGRSNKEMAKMLNISIRTIANHRAHLMIKMQATNAADLTRMCAVAGIGSWE